MAEPLSSMRPPLEESRLPNTAADFDPLVEFYGMWNTQVAEHYLPIPEVRAGKYECLRGYLIMSPREGAANSYGESKLGRVLGAAVEKAGFVPYSALNMLFEHDTWIEPDLTLLRESAGGATWVPAEKVLMPIEFVSPSSKRRDRIDKPRLCAEAGVPWYLRVEIDPGAKVFMKLDRLEDGAYVEHVSARSGERFKLSEPFALDFDPAELLEP